MSKQAEDVPEKTIAEPYGFHKHRIPKTLSHPLKRSLLDAALAAASVFTAVAYVYYTSRQNGNVVLEAMFYPEQSTFRSRGKVDITLLPVPKEHRRATEQLLLAEGLPRLVAWLSNTQSAANVWRGTRHTLTMEIVGGILRCSDQ